MLIKVKAFVCMVMIMHRYLKGLGLVPLLMHTMLLDSWI